MRVLLIRPPARHTVESEVPEAVEAENLSYPPLALLSLVAFDSSQVGVPPIQQCFFWGVFKPQVFWQLPFSWHAVDLFPFSIGNNTLKDLTLFPNDKRYIVFVQCHCSAYPSRSTSDYTDSGIQSVGTFFESFRNLQPNVVPISHGGFDVG